MGIDKIQKRNRKFISFGKNIQRKICVDIEVEEQLRNTDVRY